VEFSEILFISIKFCGNSILKGQYFLWYNVIEVTDSIENGENMKKFGLPLLIILFLIVGLTPILISGCTPEDTSGGNVIAISAAWTNSGHADYESESFVHWDEEEVPEVPINCAKCHSAHGYIDFLGEDGSAAGSVDEAAPLGTVVTCNVCHNPTAHAKDSAIYPSGVELSDLGQNATCIECHQGRTAGTTVENAVADLGDDQISSDLRFINVHYKIGGATRYGSLVNVGYEYPGKEYYGFYEHVEDYQNCTECHNPHSLEIRISDCAACHSNVTDSIAQLRDIRNNGTPDYDGDGNTTEGIYDELMGVHALFYEAILFYSQDVSDAPILYADAFPYWFNDSNGNGQEDDGEVNFGNQYASWTPRILKAAYNYHLVGHDPGGYTHNSSYLIQLMYDGIEDLGGDVSSLARPEN